MVLLCLLGLKGWRLPLAGFVGSVLLRTQRETVVYAAVCSLVIRVQKAKDAFRGPVNASMQVCMACWRWRRRVMQRAAGAARQTICKQPYMIG